MKHLLDTGSVAVPESIVKEVSRVYAKSYLFGSRRKGILTLPKTDWDFAFPSPLNEAKENARMESLGWELKPSHKYKDTLHFQTWEKTVDGHKVQMCSKFNFEKFTKVFSALQHDLYWDLLHKSSPLCLEESKQTLIFDMLYASYEEGRKATRKAWYDAGREDGYDSGFSDGYDDGYDTGQHYA